MVDNLKVIFSLLRSVNFKIFFNHGAQFECIFSHLKISVDHNSQVSGGFGQWQVGIKDQSLEIYGFPACSHNGSHM